LTLLLLLLLRNDTAADFLCCEIKVSNNPNEKSAIDAKTINIHGLICL
jgi:predicted transcriptional regulator